MMVGVNFGKTTLVDNEEEFQKEIHKRKLKNSDKVNKTLKKMLLDEDSELNKHVKEEIE